MPRTSQTLLLPTRTCLLPELTIGRVLGRGGFCVVSDISKIVLNDQAILADHSGGESPSPNLDHSEASLTSSQRFLAQYSAAAAHNNSHTGADEDQIHNVVQDRHFMEKFCIRKGKDTRYAIKRLQDSSFKDAQVFVNGVVDLAIEARFLSVIRHPNIIKMRAMRCGSPFTDGHFFVVLDRLYDILTSRLVKWNKQQFVGVRKLMDRGGRKEQAFWVERVTVAYDLACALKYLHDLKYVESL